MDDMDTEAIAVGSLCVVLSVIVTICHAILLLGLISQKRHSSSRNSAYMPNSLYTRSGVHSRRRNVSSYFFVSLWLSLVLHFLSRVSHDVPSVFVGRHILGSNIASIVGWFTRCLFYSSIFHTALIVVSAYCNRFDHGGSSGATTVLRGTCLASRMRATLVTLASWLLSVAAATTVKYCVCEYQFDPRMYGYACVYSIHYEGESEKPSTEPSEKETKILLFVDGATIGVAALWLVYANWAIRKLALKRRRLIEQARSVLSVNDGAFAANMDQNSSTSQNRSQIARMRSNRLIAMTATFFIRSGWYLLVIGSGHNRWRYVSFTFIDYLYLIACPVLYIALTKSVRDALSGWNGRREANGRVALSNMSRAEGVGDDDHSLFSFSQAPAAFTSPSAQHASTTSLAQGAEKSPFTTDSKLDNPPSATSPDAASSDSAIPIHLDQYLRPQRNRLKSNSPARYLSARRLNEKISTVSADVHRSDVYAISSFHSFGRAGDVTKPSPKSVRSGRDENSLEAILNGRTGSRTSTRFRRPIRFLRHRSPNGRQCDRKEDQRPPSPAVTVTDVDSTASDASSLGLTRAVISLNRRTAWTEQDSMENYGDCGSLKERAAAARRFVEAYEAKNARLQHSLQHPLQLKHSLVEDWTTDKE